MSQIAISFFCYFIRIILRLSLPSKYSVSKESKANETNAD